MTARITNSYGQCIRTIETDGSGNKTVKEFLAIMREAQMSQKISMVKSYTMVTWPLLY